MEDSPQPSLCTQHSHGTSGWPICRPSVSREVIGCLSGPEWDAADDWLLHFLAGCLLFKHKQATAVLGTGENATRPRSSETTQRRAKQPRQLQRLKVQLSYCYYGRSLCEHFQLKSLKTDLLQKPKALTSGGKKRPLSHRALPEVKLSAAKKKK